MPVALNLEVPRNEIVEGTSTFEYQKKKYYGKIIGNFQYFNVLKSNDWLMVNVEDHGQWNNPWWLFELYYVNYW